MTMTCEELVVFHGRDDTKQVLAKGWCFADDESVLCRFMDNDSHSLMVTEWGDKGWYWALLNHVNPIKVPEVSGYNEPDILAAVAKAEAAYRKAAA